MTGASSQPLPTTAVELKSNLRADAEHHRRRLRRHRRSTPPTRRRTSRPRSTCSTRSAPSTRLNLFFTRTGDNAWGYNVGVDAGETGGTPGELQVARQRHAQLQHATARSPPIPSTPPVDVTFTGAAAQTDRAQLRHAESRPDRQSRRRHRRHHAVRRPLGGRLPVAERLRRRPAALARVQRGRHRDRRLRQRPDPPALPVGARQLHRAGRL